MIVVSWIQSFQINACSYVVATLALLWARLRSSPSVSESLLEPSNHPPTDVRPSAERTIEALFTSSVKFCSRGAFVSVMASRREESRFESRQVRAHWPRDGLGEVDSSTWSCSGCGIEGYP